MDPRGRRPTNFVALTRVPVVRRLAGQPSAAACGSRTRYAGRPRAGAGSAGSGWVSERRGRDASNRRHAVAAAPSQQRPHPPAWQPGQLTRMAPPLLRPVQACARHGAHREQPGHPGRRCRGGRGGSHGGRGCQHQRRRPCGHAGQRLRGLPHGADAGPATPSRLPPRAVAPVPAAGTRAAWHGHRRMHCWVPRRRAWPPACLASPARRATVPPRLHPPAASMRRCWRTAWRRPMCPTPTGLPSSS